MSAAGRSWTRARWRWLTLLLVAAAVLPYLPTLGAGTIQYDDPYYIDHQPYWREATPRTLWDAVRRPVFANFQPLHLASYWLDRLVWGRSYVGLRVTQLALYAACVAALVAVARRLALPPLAVAAAGLLFAWHPSHVENVAWLSQRKDLLFLLFTLLGLAAWLGPRPWPLAAPGAPDPGARGRALAVALFALAMASKTTGIVVVPVVGVLALARRRLRADLPWLLAVALLAVAAAGLGYAAQREFGTVTPPTPWAERLPRVTRAMAWYVGQAVAPLSLLPRPPEPGPAIAPLEAARLSLLAATVAGAAWSWLGGGRTFAVLAAWFFACLAPTSGIVPFVAYVHDRYLLASTVPLALGAGLAAAAVGRRWPGRRRFVCAAAGLVGLGWLWLAAPYARAWRTDLGRVTWALRQDPTDVAALEDYAAVLVTDPATAEEGEALARRINAAAPGRRRTLMILVDRLAARGEQAQVRALLEALAPFDYKAALLLAGEDARAGDVAAAERWVELAAPRAPPNGAEVACARAWVAFARGDAARAAEHLRRATEALVEWEHAWWLLALAERAAGRADAAAAVAPRLAPGPCAALLAHLALDRGDEAAALAGSGHDAEDELVRARLAARQGRLDEARAALDRARGLEAGRWPPGRVGLEPELRALDPR